MTMPPKPNIFSASIRPAGESWVWVASMGLSIGLMMIIFLLGMILFNGLEVFWPKPIARLELRAGSTAGIAGARVFGGEIVKRQVKPLKQLDAAGHPLAAVKELQLFVGNKDAYGFGYKFVDLQEIAAMSRPADVVVAERMEYGNAIFTPQALRLADGTVLPAASGEFAATFARLVAEGNARRAKISHLERDLIGDINRQIDDIRLEERAARARLAGPAQSARLAELTEQTRLLQTRYEVLAAEARALRAAQGANAMVGLTLDGRERVMPLGQIVHYYHPNRLGFAGKAGLFLHRLWGFLSEEPREANTEGGIFPAIFGTFVMTLLMSVAVTPFGVLAAIYLREYARQGFFVRCVRIAVNNLAGVPSIVFGVFGLGFFVYLVGGTIDGLFFNLRLPTPTFGTGGILWADRAAGLAARHPHRPDPRHGARRRRSGPAHAGGRRQARPHAADGPHPALCPPGAQIHAPRFPYLRPRLPVAGFRGGQADGLRHHVSPDSPGGVPQPWRHPDPESPAEKIQGGHFLTP